jgi:hypothetical protein
MPQTPPPTPAPGRRPTPHVAEFEAAEDDAPAPPVEYRRIVRGDEET